MGVIIILQCDAYVSSVCIYILLIGKISYLGVPLGDAVTSRYLICNSHTIW